MRTSCAVCAAFAAGVVPASAGAQTLPLTESQAPRAARRPRVRGCEAARAGVDVARADVSCGRPLAESACHVQPRGGRRHHGKHADGVAGAADHRPAPAGRQRRQPPAWRRRPAAPTTRSAGCAPTSGWRSRISGPRRIASGSWRAAAIGCAIWPSVLGRREAAGEAAGFDRLRAEREVIDVDADRAIAATERARAQAILASFLAAPRDAAAIEAVRPASGAACLPAVDELIARGGTVARRARRARAGARCRRVRRTRRRASSRFPSRKSWRARSRRTSAAATSAASSASMSRCRCSIGHGPSAPRRRRGHVRLAPRPRCFARRFGRRSWRGAPPSSSAATSRIDIGSPLAPSADQIERIAQVSYEAGERGILELLDAYRTASSARMRQAALDAAVREAEIELEFVSGWEIP